MTREESKNAVFHAMKLWPNHTLTEEQVALAIDNMQRHAVADIMVAIRDHRTTSKAPTPEFATIYELALKAKTKRTDQLRLRFGQRTIDCRKRAMQSSGVDVAAMSDLEFSVRYARAGYISAVLPLLQFANTEDGKAEDQPDKDLGGGVILKRVAKHSTQVPTDTPREKAMRRYDQLCSDIRQMMEQCHIEPGTIDDALALITIEDKADFRAAMERLLKDQGINEIPTV